MSSCGCCCKEFATAGLLAAGIFLVLIKTHRGHNIKTSLGYPYKIKDQLAPFFNPGKFSLDCPLKKLPGLPGLFWVAGQ
jgi:hypothetical protein